MPNLCLSGRMIMGDNTYKHVYENITESTRDVTNDWANAAMSPAKLDQLFKRADSASQVLRSAIKTNLESPGMLQKKRITTPPLTYSLNFYDAGRRYSIRA